MHISTCGHRVEEGLTCTIDEHQIGAEGEKYLTYGTYCWDCLQNKPIDDIHNSEIKKIMQEIANLKKQLKKIKKENNDLKKGL